MLDLTPWTFYSGRIGQKAAICVTNIKTNLLDNEDFKTIIHSLPPRNGRIHGADESKAKSLFTLFCFILPERLRTAFTYYYTRN
jgi:hypothetical protein